MRIKEEKVVLAPASVPVGRTFRCKSSTHRLVGVDRGTTDPCGWDLSGVNGFISMDSMELRSCCSPLC